MNIILDCYTVIIIILTFYYCILFSVNAVADETETPLKKIKDNTALLWRTLRIAVPFYFAVMILCSIGLLEPQCCDLQNNYKWSFALGLRYMNGPPPTWCVLGCKLIVQNQNATKFHVSSKLFLYIIVLLLYYCIWFLLTLYALKMLTVWEIMCRKSCNIKFFCLTASPTIYSSSTKSTFLKLLFFIFFYFRLYAYIFFCNYYLFSGF